MGCQHFLDEDGVGVTDDDLPHPSCRSHPDSLRGRLCCQQSAQSSHIRNLFDANTAQHAGQLRACTISGAIGTERPAARTAASSAPCTDAAAAIEASMSSVHPMTSCDSHTHAIGSNLSMPAVLGQCPTAAGAASSNRTAIVARQVDHVLKCIQIGCSCGQPGGTGHPLQAKNLLPTTLLKHHADGKQSTANTCCRRRKSAFAPSRSTTQVSELSSTIVQSKSHTASTSPCWQESIGTPDTANWSNRRLHAFQCSIKAPSIQHQMSK